LEELPSSPPAQPRSEAQRPVEVIVMWLNVPPTAIVAMNLTLALLNKTINLLFSSVPATKCKERNCLAWTAFHALPGIAPQCRHLFD